MGKETTNFLQVGRMIECGSCHPEKFEDCKSIEKKHEFKCDCVCHQPDILKAKDCPKCHAPVCMCHDSPDLEWEKLKSEFYKLDGQLAQGWHYSGELMNLWAEVLNFRSSWWFDFLSNQRTEIINEYLKTEEGKIYQDYQKMREMARAEVLEKTKKEIVEIITENSETWQPHGKKDSCFIIEEEKPFWWRISPKWAESVADKLLELKELK